MHKSVLESRKGHEDKEARCASASEREAGGGLRTRGWSEARVTRGSCLGKTVHENSWPRVGRRALGLRFHLWVGSASHIRSRKSRRTPPVIKNVIGLISETSTGWGRIQVF